MAKGLCLFRLTLIVISVLLQSGLIAQDLDEKTQFNFGGYVKLDMIQSFYQNGDAAASSPLRDFILPGAIPVGDKFQNRNLDLHVKESRFNFEVASMVNNKRLHAFVELDFLLSSQGDEKVSNSFNPRMRHFFLEYDRFLIGQTWSNFMVVVIPDDLDFAGALEGLVFIRQPQIRYKFRSWSFSIENPQTTVTAYQGDKAVLAAKELYPDLTARKDFKGTWGQWSVAGIFRFLSARDSLSTIRQQSGYGFTTGGKIWLGKKGDDVRGMVTYGSGLGRYLAAGFISDVVFNESNQLSSLNSINGYIAYNHFWIPEKLSSSFNSGIIYAKQNQDLLGGGSNLQSYSVSGNLKYDPVPQFRTGIELTYAYRELQNGVSGSLWRVQVSFKYRFGYTDVSTIEK